MAPGGPSTTRRNELVLWVQRVDDEIARAEVPAAALRATVTDPSQSARYRQFLGPLGFADELRAVLRVGDSPWGAINLFRRRGREPFSRQEIELVASCRPRWGRRSGSWLLPARCRRLPQEHRRGHRTGQGGRDRPAHLRDLVRLSDN